MLGRCGRGGGVAVRWVASATSMNGSWSDSQLDHGRDHRRQPHDG